VALRGAADRLPKGEMYLRHMKVTQAEHSCMSLMGCSMSEQQEAQLVEHFKHVVIMLDGDEAGRKAAGEIAARLARKLWVRVVDLQDGKQPDQLSTPELQELLSTILWILTSGTMNSTTSPFCA
jgi:flagellar biosynthesis regulator FlaF